MKVITGISVALSFCLLHAGEVQTNNSVSAVLTVDTMTEAKEWGGLPEKFNIIRQNAIQVSNAKSIQALITASLGSHPTIKSSEQAVKGAQIKLDGAKWNYFPVPTIDMSQSGSGRRAVTARLDQPLWTGGRLEAGYDSALSQKKESQYQLDENAYNLVENLIGVIQNYAQAKWNIYALEEGRTQLRMFDEMVRRRVESGVSAQADKELINSRLLQMQTDLSVAKVKLETARSQLKLISGLDQCTPDIDNEKVIEHEESIEQIIDEMKTFHPSLKRLSAQIKTAEAEKKKESSVLWPTVSLRAEHQAGSVYYDSSASANSVYFALQMSPGAGLSSLSNIQAAESKILGLRFDLQSKEQELIQKTISHYNEYKAAQSRYSGMVNTISSSQKVLDSHTRLFLAGKTQWLDLVNLSRDLTNNKVAFAEMQATLLGSSWKIALLKSRLDVNDQGNK